eukprot:jgi/Mesvir1/26676/Mv20458-RA.3
MAGIVGSDTPARWQPPSCGHCQVFVNNVFIGDHRIGGYSPFWLALPASVTSAGATSRPHAGARGTKTSAPNASGTTSLELLVVVDNRFNTTLAPTFTGGDFYFYGGITRSVALHELPPVTLTSHAYIHQVATFTRDVAAGLADVTVWLRRPCMGTGAGNHHQMAACPPSATQYSTATASPAASSVWLLLEWDARPSSRLIARGAVDADGRVVLRGLRVPGATAWSLESPNLHTLSVSLLDLPTDGPSWPTVLDLHSPALADGPVVDTVVVRFGLRVVGINASTGRLTLNSRTVKLKGVNRHTMWPDTGAALTLDQVLTDVTLLKQLGANFVRGAHYPQDQRFLDLMDEAGIAVWEETLGPSVTLDHLHDAAFMAAHLAAVEEMVLASINHPSVLLLAFFNEGPSKDPAACNGYNASAAAIRALVGTWADTASGCQHVSTASIETPPAGLATAMDTDIRNIDYNAKVKGTISDNDSHGPAVADLRVSSVALGPPPASRLVTWASNAARDDQCLPIADVISFNSYPGWYFGLNTSLHWPAKFWKEQLVFWVRQHYPHKPFLISETGAGAVYEWRNATHKSLEGQGGHDMSPAWTAGHGGDGPLASYVATGGRSVLSQRLSQRARLAAGQAGQAGKLVSVAVGDAKPPRWSQEYQMQLVAGIAKYAVEADAVSGIAFWQMTDTKASDDETEACGACDYAPHPPDLSKPWDCLYINVTCRRPGGENHKGLVDFWRRKKISYDAVASIYKGAGPQDTLRERNSGFHAQNQ